MRVDVSHLQFRCSMHFEFSFLMFNLRVKIDQVGVFRWPQLSREPDKSRTFRFVKFIIELTNGRKTPPLAERIKTFLCWAQGVKHEIR